MLNLGATNMKIFIDLIFFQRIWTIYAALRSFALFKVTINFSFRSNFVRFTLCAAPKWKRKLDCGFCTRLPVMMTCSVWEVIIGNCVYWITALIPLNVISRFNHNVLNIYTISTLMSGYWISCLGWSFVCFITIPICVQVTGLYTAGQ